METKQRPLSILMFPWLGHGHISPYLELAKKLTTRNFLIHMCSTPANLVSIKKKLSINYSDSIRLVDLHLPCLPQLPPHYHTTNGLPLHLMPTLKQAFDMSEPEFSKILITLKPDILIYDYLQPWAPILANSYNIPAVEFITFTPSMMTFYHHFCGDLPSSDKDFPFPEIRLSDRELVAVGNIKVKDNGGLLECTRRSDKIVLFKTFREIEGKYLDYFEESIGKKAVPAGALVQDIPEEDEPNDEFIDWLDEKEPLSTIFVSFGSEYYCSKEELEEIALGLELSKVNFIWVIRFPVGDDKNIQQVLPNGYLERVKQRGFVVEKWAPQMRILKHSSIGGFVSHCGVSSVMESLKIGVPIIAMPMHLDQPVNARLVGSLGLAMEVKRDGEGRYCKEEIARVVRMVVMEEKGKDLRRKAKEMSSLVLNKGDEEIDGVANELAQLCKVATKI